MKKRFKEFEIQEEVVLNQKDKKVILEEGDKIIILNEESASDFYVRSIKGLFSEVLDAYNPTISALIISKSILKSLKEKSSSVDSKKVLDEIINDLKTLKV